MLQTAMQKTEMRIEAPGGGSIRFGSRPSFSPGRSSDSAFIQKVESRGSSGVVTYFSNVDSVIRDVLAEMELRTEYRISKDTLPANPSGLTFSLMLPANASENGRTRVYVDFDQGAFHVLKRMGWLVGGNILLLIIVSLALVMALVTVFRQKQVYQMRKEFINNLTHDFKTPVSNVSLALEGLIQFDLRRNPEKADAFMDIAQKENRRLKLMIEKVLNLAAFERGKVEICKSQVDVHDIIRDIAKVFEVQVQHRDGSLDCSLGADESIILGDRDHLTQVVFNLLDNANKYSKQKPLIRVSTSNPAGTRMLEIAVSDQGIGIPPEHQELIFEPFRRHDQARESSIKGFGLGLYYARQICRMHKGDIKVSSITGKGSTFTIQLPLP